jgi:hypothetical protein
VLSLFAAVFTLGLALVLGGRLSALGEARLKSLWLLLLAGALKLFELAAPDSFLSPVWPFLLSAQMVSVAIFAVLNIRVAGLGVVLLGSLSNLVVVALNGGYMPVAEAAVFAGGGSHDVAAFHSAGHIGAYTLLTPATRLGWLGDTILAPRPFARALSPGDLVLAVGVVVALLALTRTPSPVFLTDAIARLHKIAPVLNGGLIRRQ